MSVFKAYDIRGVWGEEWGPEIAYKIGRHLPHLLRADRILVGRDARVNSEEVFEALTKGLTDSGCDVDDVGQSTTPMIYWLTARWGYRGSVQITASHNPPQYNGLKISREDALPVGGESGLKELEDLCSGSVPPPTPCRGSIRILDGKTEYFEFLRSKLPPEDELKSLRICIDLSNGMTALFVPDLLPGATLLNQQIDGRFPAHEPNPLEPKNRRQLEENLRDGGYDLGMIFDGDGDRVMFYDEEARFVSPDLITAVLAEPWLLRGPRSILADIRTSRAVEEEVRRLGGRLVYWKVGHAFAKIKMREIDAPVGGELAGHYYFKDFYWCDSGVLAASMVLWQVLQYRRLGMTFGQRLVPLRKYANSGELNFRVTDKERMIELLRERWMVRETPLSIQDFDGIRIDYADWWFNVRMSHTEPYLRLVVEAKTESLLARRLEELKQDIEGGC